MALLLQYLMCFKEKTCILLLLVLQKKKKPKIRHGFRVKSVKSVLYSSLKLLELRRETKTNGKIETESNMENIPS